MNASVQPRSIGARARSAASTSAAISTASGWSASPSSLTTVSSASAVGVDRRRHDVPGNPGDPERAGDRKGPRQRPARGQEEHQRHGRVASQQRRPSKRSISTSQTGGRIADRAAHRVEREPPADQEAQRLGRDERGVDQEERDHHADDRADRGMSPGGGRRPPQGVQPLDASRDGEQPADADDGRLRPAEGRREGQQGEAQHHGARPVTVTRRSGAFASN